MKAQIKKIMKEIKEEDFNSWKASFWLIKRKKHPKDKSNSYSAMRVDIDDKLPRRFRGYLKKQRQDKKYHLESYDYSNADCDDVLLTIESEITDFSKIEIEIGKGFDNARATSYSDLLNSWAYVVLFEEDNKKLYAWKKLVQTHSPKKLHRKILYFSIITNWLIWKIRKYLSFIQIMTSLFIKVLHLFPASVSLKVQ